MSNCDLFDGYYDVDPDWMADAKYCEACDIWLPRDEFQEHVNTEHQQGDT